MDYDKLCELSMEIISNAGAAKSLAMESIDFSEEGDFKNAEIKIEEALNLYVKSHEVQTELIFNELNTASNTPINILMVHAQDHLTMGLIAIENAKIVLKIYKNIKNGGKND